MYLYIKKKRPSCYCDVHSYNTGSKNSYRLPCCRTNVKKFLLRIQRPKIFNSLRFEIQNASSIDVSASKLKLFSLAFFSHFVLLVLTFSFSFLLLHF